MFWLPFRSKSYKDYFSFSIVNNNLDLYWKNKIRTWVIFSLRVRVRVSQYMTRLLHHSHSSQSLFIFTRCMQMQLSSLFFSSCQWSYTYHHNNVIQHSLSKCKLFYFPHSSCYLYLAQIYLCITASPSLRLYLGIINQLVTWTLNTRRFVHTYVLSEKCKICFV